MRRLELTSSWEKITKNGFCLNIFWIVREERGGIITRLRRKNDRRIPRKNFVISFDFEIGVFLTHPSKFKMNNIKPKILILYKKYFSKVFTLRGQENEVWEECSAVHQIIHVSHVCECYKEVSYDNCHTINRQCSQILIPQNFSSITFSIDI